ncbi:MAG: hypothetical protein PWP38_1846 [Clostridiales bacterium]|jgi:hypothetical protein|nr:hypothetical protein [Clostridiales bacterium]
MKKIATLLLILTLLLSACGSEEGNAGGNAENSQSQNESSDTIADETAAVSMNLHDEEALKAYFYDLYKVMAEPDNLRDEDSITSQLSFYYADINGDGEEDVICYSEAPASSFKELALVTIEDGEYTTIPNELEPEFVYEQSFLKEGDFLIRKVRGGGTGISSTSNMIYYAADDRIVNTGTSLAVEGYTSIPPMPSAPNGVSESYKGEYFDMSYKIGTDEDKWLMFQYDYTETDDINEEIIYSKSETYTFEPSTHQYQVQVNNESGKAGTQGETPLGDDGVYVIDTLKAGQKLSGFDVTEAYDNVGSDAFVGLENGSVVIEGELWYDQEMWDEFLFTADDPVIDHPIRFNIDGQTFDIDRPGYASFQTNIEDYLTAEQIDYVKNQGQNAKIKLTVTSFNINIAYASEGGEGIGFSSFEWLDDMGMSGNDQPLSDSEIAESISGDKLTGLHNESFYTTKQGEFVVNYPDYRLVVIPMFDTVNKDLVKVQTVDFEGDYLNALKFTVYGKLEDVTILNIEGMDDTGTAEYIGDITNAQVVVNANLPNDMSTVKVTGKFYDGEGMYIDVAFNLDNMRSLEEYQIIAIE